MTRPSKPLDVGDGVVCASFAADGAWLSLATVHPVAGFVELTGLPRFRPEWRGDVDAVRRYRAWMTSPDHAVLRVDTEGAAIIAHEEWATGSRSITQRLVIRAGSRGHPSTIGVRFRGRLALPALAEITETDPPADDDTDSRTEAEQDRLVIHGPGGPLVVEARLSVDAGRPPRWQVLPGDAGAVAWLDWPADPAEVQLTIRCRSDDAPADPPAWRPANDPHRARRPTPPDIQHPSDPPDAEARPLRIPAHHAERVAMMTQRALRYVRECTALLVRPGERCILTDHRILPLSWTRDAWWQARLLLASWSRGGPVEDAVMVADHLRWLFLRCERPDGRWVRSHHADGRRKDRPFQADQQLSPLLELTDHLTRTDELPELPPGHGWDALVADAWAGVARAIDPASGLIATDENAADDPATHPFLLAHQILLWHTASSLAAAAPRLGLPSEPFATVAARVRTAVDERFVVPGPLGAQWAYAIDGHGGAERYMDANDLPVALAPLWRFCPADDPVWRATLRFAFDPANPGYSPGPAGGLGSRHTPGTWTLGDIMGWLAFSLMGEWTSADVALERLMAIAFDDGMLPEAYDSARSGSVVRHWFAWPGATFATLVLEQARIDAPS
ncbi:MAG: glycoside hydrolase family 125 protein [Chloroflexi bacterium]|nr:glycoside hydrolase family 125 protein [Chloroflexota bacterium]